MQTFLLTLVLFAVAMVAMAAGLLFGGRRLQGSCGGTGKDCSCSEAERQTCALRKRAA